MAGHYEVELAHGQVQIKVTLCDDIILLPVYMAKDTSMLLANNWEIKARLQIPSQGVDLAIIDSIKVRMPRLYQTMLSPEPLCLSPVEIEQLHASATSKASSAATAMTPSLGYLCQTPPKGHQHHPMTSPFSSPRAPLPGMQFGDGKSIEQNGSAKAAASEAHVPVYGKSITQRTRPY